MTWGTCYSGFNNIHFNFPPLMNDTRNFSTYQPGTVLDEKLKAKSNIKNNSDYRKYLQTNADSIIKNNQYNACGECSTCPYIGNKNNDNNDNNNIENSPYIFNSILSNDQPFGYENSDLKNIYLSRQQLDARMYSPRINLS